MKNSPTNILILSLSAGSGHVRAAEAIKNQATLDYPQIHVTHIDMAGYLSFFLHFFMLRIYRLLARHAPWLWGIVYRLSNISFVSRSLFFLSRITGLTFHARKLLTLISHTNPDYIIATHFLAANILYGTPFMKKLSVVPTDYELHLAWITKHIPHYFVATPSMKKILTRLSPQSKITVSGIPVDPVFFSQKDIQALRVTHNIIDNTPNVLVLSGGQGLSQSDAIITDLFSFPTSLHITVIAGKNKTLQRRLSLLTPPTHITLTVVGWTNVIDEYMRVSHLIISKPGGLTVSECLILQKPLLMVDPIPGQEEANARFVSSHGYGVCASENISLNESVQSLLSSFSFPLSSPPTGASTILQTILTNKKDD
ncbi:MAG: hypothetical protein HN429_02315 [Candidatus Magasanikbacteria bacterium]|nr:hypothetical protein [Candidatus Magasanikbacteria bacterium]